MHELSLVKSIFSTLEAELAIEELAKVAEVELKIGLLANVEPILLQNAFTAFQEANQQYQQVALSTIVVPVVIFCSACQQESEVVNYVFKCAHCGQPSRDIRTGEELLIHRIHFESA